jgi:hypothetical protein
MKRALLSFFLASLFWGGTICAEEHSVPVADLESKPVRLYGALRSSLEHAISGRDIGWRVAIVSIRWDLFEPKRGVINQAYVEEIARKKQAFRKLGYKLQVDFGVQYAADWVFELPQGRYRNQYGDEFKTGEGGKNVPNVVFNAEVRRAISNYFGEVFTRLGIDWDFVRLGCAKYGELNYPQAKFGGHTNCYWAFDDLAQGKTAGLPSGMSPCPVPGWMPGMPSPLHASASAFAGWYLDCLKNYQDWQITTVRRWYGGDLCMLYGSTGLRPDWLESAIVHELNGTTSAEINGEIQQGYDWTRMIGGLNDPKTIVYCTWIDGTLRNHKIFDDDSADPNRWSPVHWQVSLAQRNPLKLRVWGENTGRNNRESMRLTFEFIRRYNLMGVMWAFEPDLFADPNPNDYATFAGYASFIRKYR